ncbi:MULTISPECIES: hypothetical protein [Burkholderia]|uniref:hypothetical protein n=1 Tax=Burkholderia TaxID=32008 RepID=UPI000D00BF03|nr:MULTISPECIES: hypothetical protein [Burkholderia]PRG27005.1 hypothetical protein C6T62_27015 [Burkholderia multivorans]
MAFLRNLLNRVTGRAVDEPEDPPVPMIGPTGWSRSLVVVGAIPEPVARREVVLDLVTLRAVLHQRMVEIDWSLAMEEDAERSALAEEDLDGARGDDATDTHDHSLLL